MPKRQSLCLCIFLLFCTLNSFAVNPERDYRYTPEDYNLNAVRLSVKTKDGASVSVWRIPSVKKPKANVVIAGSDAGNMSYWLSLAYYLHSLNYEIWLFDYRGFGESSDFDTKPEMLFYDEYVSDLETVLKTVESRSRKPVFLIGYSMGTTIINEYLNNFKDNRIKALVYDGFVGNPFSFVARQHNKGKHIELPQGYMFPGVYIGIPALYIYGLQDEACSKTEIPESNAKCLDFDCGHIMSLSKFPNEYIQELDNFLVEQLKNSRK